MGSSLLQQSALNLGVSRPVPQLVDGTSVVYTSQRYGLGNLVPLLYLHTIGSEGRQVVLNFGATTDETEDDAANVYRDMSYPLVGIVEWGNGAVTSRIEFDIPSPSRIPTNSFNASTLTFPANQMSPRYSGVSFSVTGSVVRTFARNDNNLSPVVPYVTPGTQVFQGVNVTRPDTLATPTVFVHASYGSSAGAINARLYRSILLDTYYLWLGRNVAGCGIPPFAKRVYISRCGTTPYTGYQSTPAPSVTVRFFSNIPSSDANLCLGMYSIPFGEQGVLEVPPGAMSLFVTSDAPVTSDLAFLPCRPLAIFELAV